MKSALKEKPIQEYPGEIIHTTTYKTGDNLAFTAIEKFQSAHK